ncbi:MAG: hypothetical protein AB1515_09255 [Nitrospirota bacterium]
MESEPRVSSRRPRLWPVDLAALFIAGLALWTINAEFIHLGGFTLNTSGEVRLALAVTPGDLRADQWQVGAVTMKEDQGIYQVHIIDHDARELFALKLAASTGLLAQRKSGGGSKRQILPIGEIRERAEALLPQLAVGEIIQRPGKPFAQALLLHDEQEVARVKVDPQTGRPFDPAAAERRAKMKKWIPGDLIMPLGWLGAGLVIIATLYYSWRRSLVEQLQLGQTHASAARRALDQTLRTHCWMSFVAAAIVLAHTANDWNRVTWSVSWLTLALTVVATGSGVAGKYLLDRQKVLTAWRRFHLPLVLLLFIVLILHVLDQSGLFEAY